MKKHVNIPIFIPHLACPNDCVFCNQKSICAAKSVPAIEQVYELIRKAIETIDFSSQSCEVAFFGGSFTGIEEGLMREYLECANSFSQIISGIRLSTRPDYISQHTLDVLKQYNVTTIELGVQSMRDAVLKSCDRGHDGAASVMASRLIKENGFELILQMMTGLPGDTQNGAMETAVRCADLEPDGVRIYPCVVLKNTRLCDMYSGGLYIPASLKETVGLCARLVLHFEAKGIPVIRVGLFSESSMVKEDIVAGPFHPAFGELCENKIYFDIISEKIALTDARKIRVSVGAGELSKAIGQHRSNVRMLCGLYGLEKLVIAEDGQLIPRKVEVNIL